jgi:hypothetical protein
MNTPTSLTVMLCESLLRIEVPVLCHFLVIYIPLVHLTRSSVTPWSSGSPRARRST